MGLPEDHIPKLRLTVNDPIVIVEDNLPRLGRYRTYSCGILYVEHDNPPSERGGRWGIFHASYSHEALDDAYPLIEDLVRPQLRRRGGGN